MAARITVRYWAGAKRAAGVEREAVDASSIGELRAVLAGRPALAALSAAASFLVDGRRSDDATPLVDGAEVDVLPPFAGGC
ncbi:MoaD/ThiS family protein [uncultured Jatrophihabitans sp.]|uniref:MoaD/ThiS family protein n=1 Tax=uncultured Jatrophihabitans sp. TaxID=1610747 RepID=UPI0035C99C1D